MSDTTRKVPIAAAYALATVFSKQWWRLCGATDEFSGIDFARHREFIELPRAEKLLRELRALPKADRVALANALRAA